MPTTLTVTTSASGAAAATQTNAVTGEATLVANPEVVTAKQATLTTRTNGTSGSLTMAATGHGITTGARVDIYWTESGTDGRVYGATVGTVAGNVVPISGVEGGDAFPTQGLTTLYVCIPNEVAIAFEGDDVVGLVGSTGSVEGQIILHDGTDDHLQMKVTTAAPYIYPYKATDSNPIAGDSITKAFFSHRNTAASVSTMRLTVLTD